MRQILNLLLLLVEYILLIGMPFLKICSPHHQLLICQQVNEIKDSIFISIPCLSI